MADDDWKGKTAILCGASAGLGRELALELAAQSLGQLVLLARSAERLQALQRELQAVHPQLTIHCLPTDLCDRQQTEAAARQLAEAGIACDLLIQAVGKSDRGQLVDLTSAHLRELLELNLLSSLNALQCFRPLLQRPGASVVLIGSLASKFAPRFLGGYAIAKHALAALAQQARLELAAEGIHVLLACPGPIARPDAGTRYHDTSAAGALPASVRQPGAGAKLRGLDGRQLARDILRATARKKPEIIRPRKVRLLLLLAAISPSWGERLLRQNSS